MIVSFEYAGSQVFMWRKEICWLRGRLLLVINFYSTLPVIWWTSVLMAADQRKKHLNAGHSSREQHKVKRKKVILSTIRSNITLEWDDKRKSVVPWREQIVIAWRDLSAFIDSVPNCYSALADIVSVPRETFELEDLTEVLSCEVRITSYCLSNTFNSKNSYFP